MALSLSSKAHPFLPARFLPRLLALRSQSNIPPPSDLSDDGSPSTDPLLRKLEDAIHRIIVRRAAPDWLPFLPGSSYWVPPPRSTAGLAHLVDKLANPLSEEQSLSTTTLRGWPSSDFFLQGTPPDTIQVNGIPDESGADSTSDKETHAAASSNVSKSADEEG